MARDFVPVQSGSVCVERDFAGTVDVTTPTVSGQLLQDQVGGIFWELLGSNSQIIGPERRRIFLREVVKNIQIKLLLKKLALVALKAACVTDLNYNIFITLDYQRR